MTREVEGLIPKAFVRRADSSSGMGSRRMSEGDGEVMLGDLRRARAVPGVIVGGINCRKAIRRGSKWRTSTGQAA